MGVPNRPIKASDKSPFCAVPEGLFEYPAELRSTAPYPSETLLVPSPPPESVGLEQFPAGTNWTLEINEMEYLRGCVYV